MGVGVCRRVSVRQHCCMSLLKLELQMSHAGRAWLSVEPGNGGKALVKPTMEMQWWGEDLQVLYIGTLDFCCSAGSRNMRLMPMLFSVTAGQEGSVTNHPLPSAWDQAAVNHHHIPVYGNPG